MSAAEPIFEISEIRTFAFEALNRILHRKANEGGGPQLANLHLTIQMVAAEKGRLSAPNGEIRNARMRHPTNERRVLTAVSHLFNEGILAWGLDIHSQWDSPWFTITEYGESVLKGDPNPHDPEGYIRQFKEKVPNPDPIVLMYLEESLQCFRNNNLLAASVMLGVASEATFDRFFETLHDYTTGPDKAKLEKIKERGSTKEKFDLTMKVVNDFKKYFPDELQDALETQIQGIFTLIRYQRNESGHPTGKRMTREEMYGYLLIFIMQARRFYQLVDWMVKNKP